MRAHTIACCTGIAALFACGLAGDALADAHGLWLTRGGKSHVELRPCKRNENRLCGKIVWLRKPRKDVKNDDESPRDRDLVDTDVVWDP